LYCRWRMDMQELFTARDCNNILDVKHVEQQLKLYKTMLTGPAMDAFTTALKHENAVNQNQQDRHSDSKLIEALEHAAPDEWKAELK
jgi:hypothetical protein